MARGFFITLEGGEGAGKSTQIKKLEAALRAQGHDVLVTREPGGTPEGEALRDVFVKYDGQDWPLAAQVLLMLNARALHIEKIIRPALEAGKIVICDRFVDSTRAYQGIVQGFGVEAINDISRLCFGDFEPDLTFILDVPVDISSMRRSRRESVEMFDKSTNLFHLQLNQAFRDIAALYPDRCVMIDASRSIDAVFEILLQEIRKRHS
jgi:dTMP kinase